MEVADYELNGMIAYTNYMLFSQSLLVLFHKSKKTYVGDVIKITKEKRCSYEMKIKSEMIFTSTFYRKSRIILSIQYKLR